jgi:hypothetical protein
VRAAADEQHCRDDGKSAHADAPRMLIFGRHFSSKWCAVNPAKCPKRSVHD